MKKTYILSIYLTLVIIIMLTLTYGFVPLYRLFCQVTGYLGNIKLIDYNILLQQHYSNKVLTIYFNADTNLNQFIEFKPKIEKLNIISGQTILVFYYLKNYSNEYFNGVAVYNIIPSQVNTYFNKIECFCFEEQVIQPFEEIELPIFFFIDPILFSDIKYLDIRNITLSYKFYLT